MNYANPKPYEYPVDPNICFQNPYQQRFQDIPPQYYPAQNYYENPNQNLNYYPNQVNYLNKGNEPNEYQNQMYKQPEMNCIIQ